MARDRRARARWVLASAFARAVCVDARTRARGRGVTFGTARARVIDAVGVLSRRGLEDESSVYG
jgi:hypothetical protein